MTFDINKFAQAMSPDVGVRRLAEVLAEQKQHGRRALAEALAEQKQRVQRTLAEAMQAAAAPHFLTEPVQVTRELAETITSERSTSHRIERLMDGVECVPPPFVRGRGDRGQDEERLARRVADEVARRLLPHQPEPPASASPEALPGASPAPAAPAAPDSASAPAGGLPDAVPDGKPEAAEARQDRRLLELRSMGADFVPHGDGWRVTRKRGALAALVEREAGRPMGTKDGVRKDLQRAVQRERERNGRLSR